MDDNATGGLGLSWLPQAQTLINHFSSGRPCCPSAFLLFYRIPIFLTTRSPALRALAPRHLWISLSSRCRPPAMGFQDLSVFETVTEPLPFQPHGYVFKLFSHAFLTLKLLRSSTLPPVNVNVKPFSSLIMSYPRRTSLFLTPLPSVAKL